MCGVGASVSTCSSVTTPYASSYTYNAPGQVTGFTLGNGVAATMGYSSTRLELTSLAYVKSSTTLFSLSYGYSSGQGNNGQITNITDNVDNGRSVSYTYDPLGRLASATTVGSTNYAQWGVSESYDRYGNRLSQSASAGSPPTPSLSFGDHGGAQTNRADTFSYDANGNMLGDGVNTSMTYDATNHLISLSNGTTGASSYVYDGNGLRVEKTTGGATTVYVFSGSKVLAEYAYGAAASSPSREYVYSGGQLIYTADSSVKYHLRDHLSVRVNTDANGNVIGQQGHYPFGEPWYENSTTTKWQFTGYERDAESGTTAAGSGNDYAMARYYLNRLGRFSSLDPLSGSLGDPQSLNHYAYVTNDPINAADPTGQAGGDLYETAIDTCADAPFSTGQICMGQGSNLTGEGGTDEFGFNWWLGQQVSPAFFTDGYNSGPNFTQAELNPGISDWTIESSLDGGPGFQYMVHIYVFGNGLDINPLNPNTQCNSMNCNWYSMSVLVPQPANSGGGGGSNSADNNAIALARALNVTGVQGLDPTASQLKGVIVGETCGSSPAQNIYNWMKYGAIKGAVAGAFGGGEAAGIPTGGIGAVPGALLGGFVGGTVTGAAGVLWGGMASVVCAASGAYGS